MGNLHTRMMKVNKTSLESSLDVCSNVFKICKQPFNLAISLQIFLKHTHKKRLSNLEGQQQTGNNLNVQQWVTVNYDTSMHCNKV